VSVTVHRAVWARARALADGDASRIEVVSTTTVVVHNASPVRTRRGMMIKGN
jgi:hypothetical protein